MTFRVGQKVVCVTAKGIRPGEHIWLDGDAPTEGEIYTVTKIFPDLFGDTSVLLAEISRSPNAAARWAVEEIGYDARRFRPIVERKTSIEVFEKMLTGKRVDA